MMPTFTDGAYMRFLSDPKNACDNIHDGYFSVDKKVSAWNRKARKVKTKSVVST